MTDYLILTIGSRGDVQPFVNLAQELAHNRGKHVVIAAHPEYRELVENAGAAASVHKTCVGARFCA